MRPLRVRQSLVKIAIDAEYEQWLMKLFTLFSKPVVNGMDFTEAFNPWRTVLLGQATHPDLIVERQNTQRHNHELVITATKPMIQPLLDACAILIDGDVKTVALAKHAYAQQTIEQLYEWYEVEANWRDDMKPLYEVAVAM